MSVLSADVRALDVLLAERAVTGRSIRVGMVGAGAAGRAIALQLAGSVAGIQLVAMANRTVAHACRAFADAGVSDIRVARYVSELDDAIDGSSRVVTADAELLCQSAAIDVIVEATGTVEYASHVVTRALESRKHVVLVNAELDATVGPLLARRAALHGVILTNVDGDEPGVAMSLLRHLRSMGLRPVAAGNLKGLVDHHRTPATQRAFAERFGQNSYKATSFADATKLSLEATILANATGFRVGRLGMYGFRCDHVREIAGLLPAAEMLRGGLIDYALGAAPHTGAFVVVHEDDPEKRKLLAYGKMGEGPFYVFYTPFHLPHVQIATTIGRAVLHHDPTIVAGDVVCETVTVAKRDLRAGQVLDGIGGYCTYGLVENADTADTVEALPIGVAEGCRVVRDIRRDQLISYRDVELPPGRLVDRLRSEQRQMFSDQHVGAGTFGSTGESA